MHSYILILYMHSYILILYMHSYILILNMHSYILILYMHSYILILYMHSYILISRITIFPQSVYTIFLKNYWRNLKSLPVKKRGMSDLQRNPLNIFYSIMWKILSLFNICRRNHAWKIYSF